MSAAEAMRAQGLRPDSLPLTMELHTSYFSQRHLHQESASHQRLVANGYKKSKVDHKMSAACKKETRRRDKMRNRKPPKTLKDTKFSRTLVNNTNSSQLVQWKLDQDAYERKIRHAKSQVDSYLPEAVARNRRMWKLSHDQVFHGAKGHSPKRSDTSSQYSDDRYNDSRSQYSEEDEDYEYEDEYEDEYEYEDEFQNEAEQPDALSALESSANVSVSVSVSAPQLHLSSQAPGADSAAAENLRTELAAVKQELAAMKLAAQAQTETLMSSQTQSQMQQPTQTPPQSQQISDQAHVDPQTAPVRCSTASTTLAKLEAMTEEQMYDALQIPRWQ